MQTFDFESAAYANFATPARTSIEPNILQINASTGMPTTFCCSEVGSKKSRGTAKDFYHCVLIVDSD